MGHKELTGAEYGSIWEECYREVVYVPSQSRYTRASLARYVHVMMFSCSLGTEQALKLPLLINVGSIYSGTL